MSIVRIGHTTVLSMTICKVRFVQRFYLIAEKRMKWKGKVRKSGLRTYGRSKFESYYVD
jgi:hypothetical protein